MGSQHQGRAVPNGLGGEANVVVRPPRPTAGVRTVAVICAGAGGQPGAPLLAAPGDVLQRHKTAIGQHLVSVGVGPGEGLVPPVDGVDVAVNAVVVGARPGAGGDSVLQTLRVGLGQ